MLSGISIAYYVRPERGNLSGTSDSVLDALARALQFDEVEREHLVTLARSAGPVPRRRTTSPPVRPAVHQVLDAIVGSPALIRNGRHNVVAMNRLTRILFAPALADPRRPVNLTRFVSPPGLRRRIPRLGERRAGNRRNAAPRGRPQSARQGIERPDRQAQHTE